MTTCILIYKWVCFVSSNKISRFDDYVCRSYYNHSVQLCMITPSSNQLIRHTIENIRGTGLPMLHFLYKNGKL